MEAQENWIYCPRNAGMIELDPVVTVDRILGGSAPQEVIDVFVDDIDPNRGPLYMTVDRCPLSMVDPDSPAYDPGVLVDIVSQSRCITAGVPDSWQLPNPSDVVIEGVVLLRSEAESAAHFRTSKNESW